MRNPVWNTTEIGAAERQRRGAVLDAIDPVLQLLVGIPAAVPQAEVVVRHIHRIVCGDRDVVGTAELHPVHAA